MDYALQEWRLLITPPSPGAWNMAVDEAILESVEQNLVSPTLRLYTWQPPCLSLGYAQLWTDIDIHHLGELGWDWVRRPTGGRAILHTDELTYSVITPLSDPRVFGGVLESYQRLSTALLAALHELSIPALSQPNRKLERSQREGTVCFELPSDYEIVVQGKKLVGSAQSRRRNMLLQHGTLPLWGDLTRITQVLTFPGEEQRVGAAVRLLSHATTIESVLGKRISLHEAQKAFITGFKSALNLEFIQSELTSQEYQRAEVLMREKYTQPSWLERI